MVVIDIINITSYYSILVDATGAMPDYFNQPLLPSHMEGQKVFLPKGGTNPKAHGDQTAANLQLSSHTGIFLALFCSPHSHLLRMSPQ